jgi:hypothetical protein
VRARLVRVLLLVVVVEAAACIALGPSGRRLRTFIDWLTIDGIVLALTGAFLVVDRPFLAARALTMGKSDPRDPVERNRFRSLGWFVLLLGGVFYGTAALLWAARGGTHGIDG